MHGLTPTESDEISASSDVVCTMFDHEGLQNSAGIALRFRKLQKCMFHVSMNNDGSPTTDKERELTYVQY